MSKSLRIALRLLSALIIALAFPCFGNAQSMPEQLNMDWLLKQPKYRNIHHDSFCRADNDNEIGNNAHPQKPNVLGYGSFSMGNVHVGIHNNYVTNFKKNSRKGRAIRYVDAGRTDYHVTAVRVNDKKCDVKVGLFIKDINNFYIIRLSNRQYEVIRYLDGVRNRIVKGRIGGKRLEVNVDGEEVEIIVDRIKIKHLKLQKDNCAENLVGLVFDNNCLSKVDDFIVDHCDSFCDAGIDAAVEQEQVENPIFGTYCAEKGVCTASSKVTNDGKKSYRFVLVKPNQVQVNANRDKALHSTVMLDGIKEKGGNNYAGKPGGNKPLDSFVLSVDVFFPADGSEKWVLDELFQELIIQVHHVGYNIPFSPSISININKGRLYLNTIWNEAIAKGNSVSDNTLNNRSAYVGRINSDDEELYLAKKGYDNLNYLPYLKKGEWHNITLYVKLGYNENQQPRTVLYLDSTLVADWFTPNAYNCQEYGEYMEFGIYKWSWDTQERRDLTPIKQRVIYFDNIKYYI